MTQTNQRYQRKMPKGGYCRQYTRGQLLCLLWSLLYLFLTAVFGGFCYLCLSESKGEADDYIVIVFFGLIALAMAALCIYQFYMGIRDALFPEKSALAKSIRACLPPHNETSSVQELFDMVDRDIESNGIWFDFGRIAVGKEWILAKQQEWGIGLGDVASYIPHIRIIFSQDKISYRKRKRTIEIDILDDRQNSQTIYLLNPPDLPRLLDCLKQCAPDALFLPYKYYLNYRNMSQDEWSSVEQDYQNRKAQRLGR